MDKTPRELPSAAEQAEELLTNADMEDWVEEIIRALCDENTERGVTIGYLLITKKDLRDERDQLKRELALANAKLEAAENVADRLLVLATKHCDREHHDWEAILSLANYKEQP